MLTRKKPESLTEAKEQVRRSHKNGFTVSQIRSVPRGGSPKDMTDTMWMSTPYTYHGEPLVAFCEVERGDIRIDQTERLHISRVELYTKNGEGRPDQNVSYLSLEDTGHEDYIVQDAQGFDCGQQAVESAVCDCAVGTVCFPHVMTLQEYRTIQEAKLGRMGRLGFLPVDGDAYTKYLDQCEREITSGIMPYVGDVQDINSLVYRRLEDMEQESQKPSPAQSQGMEF